MPGFDAAARTELMRNLRLRVKPAYFWLRRRADRLLIERWLGIDTSRTLRIQELGLEQEGRVGYEPSPWLTLLRILPRSAVSKQDVFLDMGSGMGRVVLLAGAMYPFRRVIGVELSQDLHRIALSNLEHARPRLGSAEVELVCADALTYEIPDDVTVFYIYNSFRGALFAAVMDRLVASYDRCPRRLRVIYRTPEEHDHLTSTGRFRPVRKLHGLRPGREWSRTSSTVLYEVVPAAR